MSRAAREQHGVLAIGTVGPAQLLTAFALAHTRGWPLEGARVFHIWRGDDDLLACERWLCEVFGARLTGRLGDSKSHLAKPLVTPLGSAADRIARRLVTGLRARWWARRELRRLAVAMADRVILPYRVSLEDALLAHCYGRRRVHYVADGLGIGFSGSLRLPTRLAVWGMTNPFVDGARQEIWGPAALQSAIARHGRPRRIAEASWEWVLERVHGDGRFAAIRDRLDEVPRGATCLLLQSFSESGLMERDDELELYCRLAAAETAGGEPLVVKPHPRDEPSKIETLRKRLASNGSIVLLDNGALSRMPIELLADLLSPRRLVGVCSSALFTIPARPGREVVMYDCEHLPARVRRHALDAARARGITVVSAPRGAELGREVEKSPSHTGPGAEGGHPPRGDRAEA